jgi:hypothetical protein
MSGFTSAHFDSVKLTRHGTTLRRFHLLRENLQFAVDA